MKKKNYEFVAVATQNGKVVTYHLSGSYLKTKSYKPKKMFDAFMEFRPEVREEKDNFLIVLPKKPLTH